MRDVDARQREIEFEAHIRFVAEHRVDGEINWLADDIWDALAGVGIADVRGGTEYERRIAGLRAWLRDEDGQPPETGP